MDVLSQQTGASKQQTTKATSAVISQMLGALAANASSPQGAQQLNAALERDHDGSILDMLGGLMQQGRQAPGQGMPTGGGLTDMLGGLLGGSSASSSSGSSGMGGLLGSVLGGMMQGQQQRAPQSGGGLGDLLGGLMSGTQGSDGGGLGDLLGGLMGGKATGNHNDIPPQFRKTLNGGGILDHVLGNRKGEAMQEVSETSGLSLDKIGPLMTTLAPIVMGMLGRSKKQAGLDAGGLSGALIDMVTRSQADPRQQAPDLGLAGTLLDRDGDGQIMDDIAGMGAKMLGNYFRQ